MQKSPRYLHVANGSATTDRIAAATIPGERSIWADPLHDGPVPAGLDDDALVELRSRHLAGPGDAQSAVNDLRQWRAAIANHDSYDALVLWFEHDLFDQLNLIQLLPWIRAHVPSAKPVSLICIGTFPGRERFKGLGELTPTELASLFPGRQPIADAQYELATRAWSAFRQPSPESLDALRQSKTAALPYLAPALTRFLQEYPWSGDGLSRTERRLLQIAERGETELAVAFPLMHEDESAYYVTDTSLFEMADDLARTSPPLLTFVQSDQRSVPLRGRVGLTDTGRAVRQGAEDRIAACGIDRWFGGVHLHGTSIWRWDDRRQHIRAQ